MSIIRTQVAIAYTKSTRTNAKVYIKEFKRKSIDQVLDPKRTLAGINDKCNILRIAFGTNAIRLLKEKYS